MNTQLPTPLTQIAHHLNLALLLRHHSYTTALVPLRDGTVVPVLRLQQDRTITAVAIYGPLRIHATPQSWALWRDENLLIETNALTRVMQTFADELQSLHLPASAPP